jgi:hypothetical protein
MSLRGFVLIVFAMMLTACSSSYSVSNKPPHDAMIGKNYILQRDCYVFRNMDQRKKLCLAPVGLDIGYWGTPRGEILDVGLIGKEFADVKILGMLPKNTSVRVVDVRYEGTFTVDFYEILVATEINGRQQIYGTLPLQKVYFGRAEFDPRFIVEK